MRAMILAFVTGLTAAGPACAQNVPFAEPPPASAGQSSTAVLPSLGDIMIDTQLRHIKLWYSAKANNWSLVKFELARITESLRKAAILYRNIPIEFIAAMNKPLTDMTGAAIAGNSGDFNYAYSAFTAACNSCHTAAGIPFVRVQTPTSSPFSDEVYESGKK